jgi:hypothetical protein
MKLKSLSKTKAIIESFDEEYEFELDPDYDNKWHGFFRFIFDDTNFNKLKELKHAAGVLNTLVELKEFDSRIKIEFDGDRSGEFFNITIEKRTMVKLINQF